LGYEEVEKAKIYEKEFSDLLSKVRAPRKRASRDKLDKEKMQEISGSLGDFIIKMETAWELDRGSIKDKLPALNKLKLLPEVINFLQKDYVREGTFDSGFLRACYQWLKPLPDGTLPNMKIRDGILKCLPRIEVNQDALQSSSIGKAVMVLSKHKQETAANKKICRELISKWAQPIFGVRSSFRKNPDDEMERNSLNSSVGDGNKVTTPPSKRLRRLSSSGGSSSKLDEELESTQSPSQSNKPVQLGKLYYNRPDKVNMDYTRTPSFSWTAPERKKVEKKKSGGLLDTISNLKAKPTLKRAVEIGVNKLPNTVV